MAGSPNHSKQQAPENRSWVTSLAWAAAAMAALLFIAVALNVAIGRVIHWEIVAVLGVLGFVFLSIGRQFRTI